jgi:hypothetical protein
VRKSCLAILSLLTAGFITAQSDISYNDMLKKTSEIVFSDSINVDVNSVEHIQLDTIILKAFFPTLYPPLVTKKSRPLEYFISGKITSHPYFDVLLVSTRRQNEDKSIFESVYLLTNRKDGSQINTLAVAIRRENGTIINTSATLFKDYKFLVKSRINSNGKDFGVIEEYRINEEGRFVHYPHWTK